MLSSAVLLIMVNSSPKLTRVVPIEVLIVDNKLCDVEKAEVMFAFADIVDSLSEQLNEASSSTAFALSTTFDAFLLERDNPQIRDHYHQAFQNSPFTIKKYN